MISKQYRVMYKFGDRPWQPTASFPFDLFQHAQWELERCREGEPKGVEYKIEERVIGDWSDSMEGMP